MSIQPGSPQHSSPLLRQKFFLTSHKSLFNKSGSRTNQRTNQQINTIQEYLSQHNSLQKSKTPQATVFIGGKAVDLYNPSMIMQTSPSLQVSQHKKSQRLLSGSRSRTDEGLFDLLMNNNSRNTDQNNLKLSSSLKNLQGIFKYMHQTEKYQDNKSSTSQQHGQTIIDYIDSIRRRNASSTVKMTSAGISLQSTTHTTQSQNLSTIIKRVQKILDQCNKEKQQFLKREEQMKQEIQDLKIQLQCYKDLKHKLLPQKESGNQEDKFRVNKSMSNFVRDKKQSMPLNKNK